MAASAAPAPPTRSRGVEIALGSALALWVFSISAAQLAFGLALTLWLVEKAGRGSTRGERRFPLIVPVSVFGVASLLATATALDPWTSLIEARDVLALAIFYLAVDRIRLPAARAMTLALIGAGTLAGCVGIYQGWSRGVDYRVHGTLPHYMTYAGVLMLIALIALAWLAFRAAPRATPWLLTALALILPALLLSQTRSAWLGLTAGGLVLAARLGRRWLLVAAPALLGASLLAGLLLAPDPVVQRLRSLRDLGDVTAVERRYMWRAAARALRERPLTGFGMGATDRVYREHRLPDDPRPPERRLAHFHSNPIQIAVERGLIGLAAWAWIWIAWLRAVLGISRTAPPSSAADRAAVAAGLAAVTGFHVAGLFEYNWGDSEVVSLAYFAMALPFLAGGANSVLRPFVDASTRGSSRNLSTNSFQD